mmetsp:Transcript_52684/g.171299  ORF Transcript_52684/g.171299 Transcript_52684/m.171299 type:complete len:230 (-) Transcript_52684:276-965(-)
MDHRALSRHWSPISGKQVLDQRSHGHLIGRAGLTPEETKCVRHVPLRGESAPGGRAAPDARFHDILLDGFARVHQDHAIRVGCAHPTAAVEVDEVLRRHQSQRQLAAARHRGQGRALAVSQRLHIARQARAAGATTYLHLDFEALHVGLGCPLVLKRDPARDRPPGDVAVLLQAHPAGLGAGDEGVNLEMHLGLAHKQCWWRSSWISSGKALLVIPHLDEQNPAHDRGV